jgi:transposase
MYRKRIAVDLAKDVFQIAEAERSGAVCARKRLSRAAFMRYVHAVAEPSLFIMEACGTAHYWARLLRTLGHDVMLLHARYVKPYRQRNKTDRNDCDAILEAARAGKMHPVPVKTEQQQMIQQLHRLREQWKHNRTQRINVLRSILRELGVDAPTVTEAFLKAAPLLAETPVLQAIAPQLHLILADITQFSLAMKECEEQMARLLHHDAVAERLDEVSGIGILTASAFMVAVNQPERFKNGRMLSAWLGMTPRENSSGSRRQLGSISRQGNVYVRTLLIHGARSALLAAKRSAARTPDKLTALQQWAVQCADRIGFNKATVALANKLVRICWAVWCHERRFNGNFALTLKAS